MFFLDVEFLINNCYKFYNFIWRALLSLLTIM